jgi:metal-sulfur cluster biosynthetic enzyme
MTMSDATGTDPIGDLLLEDGGIPEADTPTGRAEDAPAPRTVHPFADLPLEDDGMPSGEALKNALRAVIDPEIGYNIVDLGLVYEVTKPQRGKVHVLMTLTSVGCPLTEIIHQQCSVIMGAMPGVDVVEVEFTFTPPWSTDKIADYVREELRAMGMNV